MEIAVTNNPFWYFAVCVPGAVWDSIQLFRFFMRLFQGGQKKRRGAKHMPFRESHPRLFFLTVTLNAILIVALPVGFWLVFHPPTTIGPLTPQAESASGSTPGYQPGDPCDPKTMANVGANKQTVEQLCRFMGQVEALQNGVNIKSPNQLDTEEQKRADSIEDYLAGLPDRSYSSRFLQTHEPFDRANRSSREVYDALNVDVDLMGQFAKQMETEATAPATPPQASNRQRTPKHPQSVPPAAAQPPAVVSIPGSVTQTTNSPCSGNSVTGSVDNSGCQVGNVPPPNRKIEKSGRDGALDMLRTAPQGSSVYFVTVGGSKEIKNFESEIESLFTDARWTIAGHSFVGELHVTEIGENGPSSSSGEGLHCSSSTSSGRIALRAMQLAGYPCSEGFVAADGISADLTVQVGTRIPPQD